MKIQCISTENGICTLHRERKHFIAIDCVKLTVRLERQETMEKILIKCITARQNQHQSRPTKGGNTSQLLQHNSLLRQILHAAAVGDCCRFCGYVVESIFSLRSERKRELPQQQQGIEDVSVSKRGRRRIFFFLYFYIFSWLKYQVGSNVTSVWMRIFRFFVLTSLQRERGARRDIFGWKSFIRFLLVGYNELILKTFFSLFSSLNWARMRIRGFFVEFIKEFLISFPLATLLLVLSLIFMCLSSSFTCCHLRRDVSMALFSPPSSCERKVCGSLDLHFSSLFMRISCTLN